MKDAIATSEVFARSRSGAVRRFTLVVTAPERVDGVVDGVDGSGGWICRVALADLHRPESIEGADSLIALDRALGRARQWLAELVSSGHTLWRDREALEPFRLDLRWALQPEPRREE